MICSASAVRRRRSTSILFVRLYDALFAVPFSAYCETIRINLLPGFTSQLDSRLARALFAVVFVLVARALGVPDAASLGHLENGLQDRDARRNNDEVALNPAQEYS